MPFVLGLDSSDSVLTRQHVYLLSLPEENALLGSARYNRSQFTTGDTILPQPHPPAFGWRVVLAYAKERLCPTANKSRNPMPTTDQTPRPIAPAHPPLTGRRQVDTLFWDDHLPRSVSGWSSGKSHLADMRP